MAEPIVIGTVQIDQPGLYTFALALAAPEPIPPDPELITTPEELAAAIAAGELDIRLGAGNFGALVVEGVNGLTITGSAGSVFLSFTFKDCQQLVVRDLEVEWVIQPGQTAKTGVNYLKACDGVEITGCRMTGQPVPEGTPGAVHDTDMPWPPAGAVVVGYYAGTAIAVDDCRDVSIHDNLIRGFMQGVSFGARSDRVSIQHNEICELRTTPIRGNCDHLTIHRNSLHDMTPYRYPDNSGGDHLDFVHMWINAGYPPIAYVEVTENLMDAGGFAAIGVFLENNNQPNPGYLKAVVNRNTYLAGDTQALTFEDGELECCGNVLLAGPEGPKWPTIIHRACVMTATGNTLWDTSVYPKLSMTHPDNAFVTRWATLEEIEAERARALALIGPFPWTPPPPEADPCETD